MRDRRVVAAINRMEDFGISATDVAAREIELVARGYTVSARAAALGRVGGDSARLGWRRRGPALCVGSAWGCEI